MPVIRRRHIGMALAALAALANVLIFGLAQADHLAIGDLERRLIATRTEVVDPTTSRSPVDLRRELEAAEVQLNTAALAFPDAVSSVALQDHAIRAATVSGVAITSLAVQAPYSRPLAGVSYPVNGISLQVTGELSDLHRFLGYMERTIYETTLIEGVRLTRRDRGGWALQFNAIVLGRPV